MEVGSKLTTIPLITRTRKNWRTLGYWHQFHCIKIIFTCVIAEEETTKPGRKSKPKNIRILQHQGRVLLELGLSWLENWTLHLSLQALPNKLAQSCSHCASSCYMRFFEACICRKLIALVLSPQKRTSPTDQMSKENHTGHDFIQLTDQTEPKIAARKNKKVNTNRKTLMSCPGKIKQILNS